MEKLVDELVVAFEAIDDPWIGPPERKLLDQLLWAVGRMDTESSHALLVRLVQSSTTHLVRAEALRAMGFEKQNYDLDIILPFASIHATPPEILGALDALNFNYVVDSKYVDARPEDARRRIPALFEHPHPIVRASAVYLLMDRESNLDLILPLANDPEPVVRDSVAETIRRIETKSGD